MKVGVNLTHPKDLVHINRLIVNEEIDFIEILIDNFLNVESQSIAKILRGLPCAFHIMNSHFITKSKGELKEIGTSIKKHISVLGPIYISDHLGVFSKNGRQFLTINEIDYKISSIFYIAQKVKYWEEILDSIVFLENFPSIFKHKISQYEFTKILHEEFNCSTLFDVSNAHIADRNINESLDLWKPMISEFQHFHIAGNSHTSYQPTFVVDTHTASIDRELVDWLSSSVPQGGAKTICIEREGHFSYENLLCDIKSVKNGLSER